MSSVVSIIVPVYNSEKTLNRCVDSILNQTFHDWELLLIDDGSSDQSGKICDQYAAIDSRIKVFHKENGGVSSARNVGLANAVGKYIVFCDSDDWVYPSWLDNFGLEKNSDYDFISQGFEADKSVFGDDKFKNRYIYSLEYDGTVAEFMNSIVECKRGIFLFVSAFKRFIIQDNHIIFNEHLKHAEDAVFIFKYLCFCNKVIGTNKIGYFYYVPDWDSKYIKDGRCNLIVAKSLYESISIIMKHKPYDQLLRFYREDLTSKYIEEFKKKGSNKIECIKGLRTILKKDFKYSQLFYITKLVILVDHTYLLSELILNLHLQLKQRI